jgi:hypothetical protein
VTDESTLRLKDKAYVLGMIDDIESIQLAAMVKYRVNKDAPIFYAKELAYGKMP